MKRAFDDRSINWINLLCLAVTVVALPLSAAAQDNGDDPLSRFDYGRIPSYYTNLDFNLTSPSTWATADGGYANPGVYPMMGGGESEFFWTDQNLDVLSGWKRWGLFLGGNNIGFGAIYNRTPDIEGVGQFSVTDYRLALSGGIKSATLGMAYGWSGGDKDQFGRTRMIQLGTVQRWSRYVSWGAAGIFSTEKREQSGLFDIGVRPLGDQRLALFGDFELPYGVSLKNAPWSVGAMAEWPAGLRLVGRYFENETWNLAVVYSFGGAVNTGQLRISGSPRFNTDSDVAYTNWGVRLGFPERGFIGEYFHKERYYMSMNLKGRVVHTRYKYFDRGMTLMSILKSIEDAKNDPRIKGVALNLSGIQISSGNAWEIREALLELQGQGKHVIIYIDEGNMTTYHLATVADRLVLDPQGIIVLPGYVLGRSYLAGTLEKLGIGFDEWRFLKYKSAAETLSRTSMSDADREQRQALTDGYYETTRQNVTAARNVSEATYDSWIDDKVVYMPEAAMEAGLVDTLVRWDDIQEVVRSLEGKTKGFVGPSSVAGRYYKSQRWGDPPAIAVVYAVGVCAMDSGIRARQLEKLILGLRSNRRVKAVVLRVNSPGGSALASDLVAEAVAKCAKVKPVIVSQGDVAASGGYWISMYGDEILAQPTTVTGSIGVIGGWVWDDGVAEKLGITSDFVKRGKHADLFTGPGFPGTPLRLPHRPLDDEERELIMGELEVVYQEFVKKVAKGREMTEEDVESVAQGRVWTGDEGKEVGLIDAIGGLKSAIEIARVKAGIDPDDEVRILDYSSKGWFHFSGFSADPFSVKWWGLWDRLFSPSEGYEQAAEDLYLDEFFDDYEFAYLWAIAKNNGRAMYLVPPDLLPAEARVGAGAQSGASFE